ncbi:MAG: hypothetical protein JEZ07_12235 [Phycisphaerae bacterium]|nr:hypothetical protein [Phycisphaerae bacterium]
MKKVIIEIDTGNDAFHPQAGWELARIFRELQSQAESDQIKAKIYDINGNPCGTVKIEY